MCQYSLDTFCSANPHNARHCNHRFIYYANDGIRQLSYPVIGMFSFCLTVNFTWIIIDPAQMLVKFFSQAHTTLYMLMGSALLYMAQMPDGQIPAQMPHPMHLLASTAYSKPPSGKVFLDMAFSGHDFMHM